MLRGTTDWACGIIPPISIGATAADGDITAAVAIGSIVGWLSDCILCAGMKAGAIGSCSDCAIPPIGMAVALAVAITTAGWC